MNVFFVTLLLAAVVMGADAAAQPAVEPRAAVMVTAEKFPLNPAQPDQELFGVPRLISALELDSDHEGFGGYSGLAVSADGGRLLAVSDAGWWLAADLLYGDGDGEVIGLTDAVIAPMLGEDGKPMSKRRGDAEALAALGDGAPDAGPVLVAFERDHRVLRYELSQGLDAVPSRVAMPPGLAQAVSNKGLEALAALPDDRLLAVTEATLDRYGNMIGWLQNGGGRATDVRLKRQGDFDLTDFAGLPSGDVLALERSFSLVGGIAMRLRRIEADAIDAGGTLDGDILMALGPRYAIDNMEGLAVRRTRDGRLLLYAISDDNFNAIQRTILLVFALPEDLEAAQVR